MNISFNGDTLLVETDISLLTFLEQHNLSEKTGIAVAINQSVVPKSKWAEHKLITNDNILVITATQGG